LCGHYTLEFVRRWLFGISPLAEAETNRQIAKLRKLSDPVGGIVYVEQLIRVLRQNNPTISAEVWDSGDPERSLPLRKATTKSGSRKIIDLVERDRAFAMRNIPAPTDPIHLDDEQTDEYEDDDDGKDKVENVVHRGRLSTREMARRLLKGGDLIIVLMVDSRFLPIASPEKKRSPHYSGHFITLFSYDSTQKAFLVFDSLRPTQHQTITVDQLNRCRKLSSMACQCRNSAIVLQTSQHATIPKTSTEERSKRRMQERLPPPPRPYKCRKELPIHVV